MHQGRLEEGEQLLQECLALAQEMGERVWIAGGLHRLGAAVMYLGKYAKAQSLFERSVTLCSDLGFLRVLADATNDLGLAKMHLAQYEQARSLGERALPLAQEIEQRRRQGFCFLLLGSVALAEGACADAQGLLQKGVALFRGIGEQNDLGLILSVLACTERELGQVPQARQHLYEALRIGSDIQAWQPRLYGLVGLSLLLVDGGKAERVVELYALASCYPYVANAQWFEDVAGKHIAAAAATLPPAVVAAAQERGRARDLWSTVEELLDELGAKRCDGGPAG